MPYTLANGSDVFGWPISSRPVACTRSPSSWLFVSPLITSVCMK